MLTKNYVNQFLNHMHKAGFNPICLDDGEERVKITKKDECIDLLMNLDEARVAFKHDTLLTKHSVFFVFESQEVTREEANDILCDYSLFDDDRDGFDKAITEFMSKFE